MNATESVQTLPSCIAPQKLIVVLIIVSDYEIAVITTVYIIPASNSLSQTNRQFPISLFSIERGLIELYADCFNKNGVKRHVWTVFNNYYTLDTPPPT